MHKFYGARVAGLWNGLDDSTVSVSRLLLSVEASEIGIGLHVLTFRLPSYFLRHRLPRGGYHQLRFCVWFNISYRVIQRLIQRIFLSLSKMVYLHVDVKYTTANRLNANGTLYRRNSLSCITTLTSGLQKIISEEMYPSTFPLMTYLLFM